MIGVVYKYTNKINNKVYIGQTIDEVRRKAEHYSTKDNFYYHRALRKYKIDNFLYEVLYSTKDAKTKEEILPELNKMESSYIEQYKSYDSKFGYNLTKGGNNTYPFEKFKPIQQLDMDGNIIGEYESVQEALRKLGKKPSGKISLCCQGKRGSFLGYKWKYKDKNK